MELDEFIKQDIQRFLDEQVAALHSTSEPVARTEGVIAPEEVMLYAPSEDYVKELDEALAKRDIEKAKKIIYGFKEAYEQYTPNSPEWEEGKRLFKSLYMTFRKALEEDERRQEELLRRELEQGLSIGGGVETAPAPPTETTPTQPQTTENAHEAAPQETPQRPPQAPTPQATTQQAPPQQAPPQQMQQTLQQPAQHPTTPTRKLTQEEFWRRLDQYAQEGRHPGPERPAMPPEQEALLAQRISAIEKQLSRGAALEALNAYKALARDLAPEQLSKVQRAKYLPRILTLYRNIHATIELIRRTSSEFAAALEHTKEALEKGDLKTAMSEHRHATSVFRHLPPSEQAVKRHLITDLYGQIKARMEA
ncbi:hypothetical protein D6789_00055 [Candidatus Woesearchaeota archaeon]|nr:MAG: hypothetical protein D6789_00055 [Candidatus Woesearchaeota archaeon]